MTLRGSRLLRGLAASLDLPSLTTLRILASGPPQDEKNSELVDWVRKFGQQLTAFTFNYGCLTESALLHSLENLPYLTTLRLVREHPLIWPGTRLQDKAALLSDSVLERLTPSFRKDGDEGKGESIVKPPLPLCPKLQKLSLWPCTLEFTEKAFLKLVAARRSRHLRSNCSPTHPSLSLASDNSVSLLNIAIVWFDSSRQRNLWEILKNDDSLDLEDFWIVWAFGRWRRQSTHGLSDKYPWDEILAEEIELIRNEIG